MVRWAVEIGRNRIQPEPQDHTRHYSHRPAIDRNVPSDGSRTTSSCLTTQLRGVNGPKTCGNATGLGLLAVGAAASILTGDASTVVSIARQRNVPSIFL